MNIEKVVRRGLTPDSLSVKELKFTIPALQVHLLFSGGAGWVKRMAIARVRNGMQDVLLRI
jgi:hypothetical protein